MKIHAYIAILTELQILQLNKMIYSAHYKTIYIVNIMNRTYSKIIKHINMHAYTNFTSYDEKLSIYVQGLNSRYFEHYWEDLQRIILRCK